MPARGTDRFNCFGKYFRDESGGDLQVSVCALERTGRPRASRAVRGDRRSVCFRTHAAVLPSCSARSSSLLSFASNLVAKEPQASIRPAKKIDLVACELETAQAEFGDRLHPVKRKSDAQSLIGEELLDDHSNSRS
jgi:hypothetical protein